MVCEDGGLPFLMTAEFGTLANGRVFVAQSGLGLASGLGLFAAQPFEAGELLTAYSGKLLFKKEVEAEAGADHSYLLRIPGSGGQLIDGSQFARALRANESNPQPGSGHWVPLEGAAEWNLGAASMANDPRRAALYNARLVFKCPKGTHRDIQQLVPMRAYLCATQHIPAVRCTPSLLSRALLLRSPALLACVASPSSARRMPQRSDRVAAFPRCSQGCEIFYNYGSDKPFLALAAPAQAQGSKGSRKKEFRVKHVHADAVPQPAAHALDKAALEEAAEKEARRQRQLDARTHRASARKRKALEEADALSGGLLAAAMLQPDAPAPSCPVCGQCLQLSVAEQNVRLRATPARAPPKPLCEALNWR